MKTRERVALNKDAVKAAMQLFDTAHLYAAGQSEATIGEGAVSLPEACVVATKGSFGFSLSEHRAASAFKGGDDLVFCTNVGTPIGHRHVVRRGLDRACEAAGLGEYVEDEKRRRFRPLIRWHDLRHTAASLAISEGLDVTYVSRQLGHADLSITLSTYAHLFDAARHADRAAEALEARFGKVVESTGVAENGGSRRRREPRRSLHSADGG